MWIIVGSVVGGLVVIFIMGVVYLRGRRDQPNTPPKPEYHIELPEMTDSGTLNTDPHGGVVSPESIADFHGQDRSSKPVPPPPAATTANGGRAEPHPTKKQKIDPFGAPSVSTLSCVHSDRLNRSEVEEFPSLTFEKENPDVQYLPHHIVNVSFNGNENESEITTREEFPAISSSLDTLSVSTSSCEMCGGEGGMGGHAGNEQHDFHMLDSFDINGDILEIDDQVVPSLDNFTANVTTHVPYTDKDVLLGRGGMINAHHGNKIFRDLIKERKSKYLQCTTNSKKKDICLDVICNIEQDGGHFLKKSPRGNEWDIASPEEVKNKISQALREKSGQRNGTKKRKLFRK